MNSFYGAPWRNRTSDPRFRKPLLYPTELRAQDYDVIILNYFLKRNFLNNIKIVNSSTLPIIINIIRQNLEKKARL